MGNFVWSGKVLSVFKFGNQGKGNGGILQKLKAQKGENIWKKKGDFGLAKTNASIFVTSSPNQLLTILGMEVSNVTSLWPQSATQSRILTYRSFATGT